jgi:tetratricopeptide (TPR) repeat protein
MFKNFIKLFIVLAIIAVILSLINMNSEKVVLNLWGNNQIAYGLGVIVIIVFSSGVLATALLFGLIATPTLIRHRLLRNELNSSKNFYGHMVQARNAFVSKQWTKAKNLWEQVLKRDPSEVISRIELSKVLENSGELREGLRVLTTAKSSKPENVELYFRAAELNDKLGNKTAAIDNYALVLAVEPNRYAAQRALELCEELDRIEDALDYYYTLENSSYANPQDGARLKLKQLVKSNEPKKAKLISDFVKKNPTLIDGYVCLGKVLLAETAGDHQQLLDEVCQVLLKGYRQTENTALIDELVIVCREHSNPFKMIEYLEKAASSENNETRSARILTYLARAYYSVGRINEAKDTIDKANSLRSAIDPVSSKKVLRDLYVTLAFLKSNSSELGEAREALTLLDYGDSPLPLSFIIKNVDLEREGNLEKVQLNSINNNLSR